MVKKHFMKIIRKQKFYMPMSLLSFDLSFNPEFVLSNKICGLTNKASRESILWFTAFLISITVWNEMF